MVDMSHFVEFEDNETGAPLHIRRDRISGILNEITQLRAQIKTQADDLAVLAGAVDSSRTLADIAFGLEDEIFDQYSKADAERVMEIAKGIRTPSPAVAIAIKYREG